jgi:hypothetical protein
MSKDPGLLDYLEFMDIKWAGSLNQPKRTGEVRNFPYLFWRLIIGEDPLQYVESNPPNIYFAYCHTKRNVEQSETLQPPCRSKA